MVLKQQYFVSMSICPCSVVGELDIDLVWGDAIRHSNLEYTVIIELEVRDGLTFLGDARRKASHTVDEEMADHLPFWVGVF